MEERELREGGPGAYVCRSCGNPASLRARLPGARYMERLCRECIDMYLEAYRAAGMKGA